MTRYRVRRESEAEHLMAARHYFQPHERIVAGCKECASTVLTATWAMSAAWHKTDVAKLFARGQTQGVCRPVHR